ncbi:MAG: SDR family oxidoreductase, partial [Alphaproteobacteria bacterium]|nr:SDR family oxidoreductase [Alphaproteobacteria bacterium]
MQVETAIYPSLRGKTVFITGGGSGIGASIVEHFCAQGGAVAFVDVATAPARALVGSIGALGHSVPLFMECDLRNIADLQAAIARAGRELGPIRVLVNNAAHDERHHFSEVTPEYWDDRIAVNLRHQFFAAQAVYPQMKAAGGGSIVNFGSISWMNGDGGFAAYTASKAAVHGLTRSLARDFGPDNIRANTVVPGWVMTERQVKLWLDEAGERRIFENQCLKEKLYPPDIARMVLFLGADDSRLCTAQNFIV